MIKITQTTTRYAKIGTRWIETTNYKSMIEQVNYNNIINAKSFMTNLGGYERHIKSYTCKGYIVTHINSISPNRQNKTVYEFEFTNV